MSSHERFGHYDLKRGGPKAPIKPLDENMIIGESFSTTVYGYHEPEVVVKERKPGFEERYGSIEELLHTIEESNKRRREVVAVVKSLGGDEELIPEERSIIHNVTKGDNGSGENITYSRVQHYYPESKTLREKRYGVCSLPPKTLGELKILFLANLRLWREGGNQLDLTGSIAKSPCLLRSGIRRILPIFCSADIIIDKEDKVRLIDVEIPKEKSRPSPREHLAKASSISGTYISLGIINLLLKLHNIKRK